MSVKEIIINTMVLLIGKLSDSIKTVTISFREMKRNVGETVDDLRHMLATKSPIRYNEERVKVLRDIDGSFGLIRISDQLFSVFFSIERKLRKTRSHVEASDYFGRTRTGNATSKLFRIIDDWKINLGTYRWTWPEPGDQQRGCMLKGVSQQVNTLHGAAWFHHGVHPVDILSR